MPVTIAGYLIDASLSESHKYTASVTKYPIESGSSVADNVTKEPLQVVIEGVVSDTPLGNAVQARQASQGSPDNTFEFLPSDEAFAKLTAIYDAEEPVTIETSLKRFENMVLTELDVPVDGETGDALHFTATFEQVLIVTNNRTVIRVASPNVKKKVKKTKRPIVNAWAKPTTLYTNDGRAMMWNEKKGRYEYADSFDGSTGKMFGRQAQPNGIPANTFDVDQGAQAHNTDVTKGVVDPGKTSFYDYKRDEWMQTDSGTPVTQTQLRGIRSSPWYK